ncbi:glycosyltransferase family 4 protein [Algoriphagus sp.]|uniref:MraY family glycosyltransferase n=1 Tax=Algoriphagus sp. TaxID=1872435 RepID=UPI00271E9E31|nr:glycosyltransferase family 4 protein [Algoriphagus sp.]MDO8967463.1 glycosyltransferase family 4 protein [Algoriphagus sp.]MDP3201773.1 glycosyltransferase family 4 protein [Algoriphagus sp.]
MTLSNLIVFLFLLLVAILYRHFANKFNIIDNPNERSSHTIPTVRGGGILFPVAVILWWVSFDFLNTWMVLGLVWISVVSMLDDMFTLSRKLRFGVQFLAISMAFYDLGVFDQKAWWVLPILYFVALGIINAINFMDGINGITGLYGLVFFGSLLAIHEYMPVFDENLIQYIVLAILVFLIFNLRKKAFMFAGDIGSISLAYLMIYFLVQWYLASNNWTIILFLLVYGADSFITLGQRLIRGENVSQPHRTHLYQIFANQLKKDHVLISLVFAVIQIGVNVIFFIYPQSYPTSIVAAVILIATALIYLMIKFPLIKRYQVFEK